MFVRLFLSISFFCYVVGNQTSRIENHANNPVENNRTSRSQPSEIKELCRISHNFTLPQSNSIINVTCIKHESEIEQLFMNLFSRQFFTLEQVALTLNKSLDYFRRDGVLATCVLSCNRGQPFSLDSDRAEPIAINFGCDDISRFACRESTCPSSIYDVDNGVVTCTQGVNANSVCHVVCDTGYLPRSPITKTCSDSNQLWEPSSPFVCAAACSVADLMVENGDVVCSDGSFNQSVCTLHCHDGFKPAGAVAITCHESVWIPPTIFKCKKVPQCSPLPTVQNGQIICADGFYLLSQCILQCDQGYSPESLSEQWCFPDDNNKPIWAAVSRERVIRPIRSNERMTCEITPDQPREIENFCNTAPENRTLCRNNQVTREICLQHNCCWDASPNVSFPCYQSNDKNSTARVLVSELREYNSTDPIQVQLYSLKGTLRIHNSRPNNSFPSSQPSSRHHMTEHHCGCNNIERGYFTGECTNYPTSSRGLSNPLPNYYKFRTLSLNSHLAQPIPRIYGGSGSNLGTWPWHAVVYFSRQLCGGSLIRHDLVLTAAHCVTDETDRSVLQEGRVVLGIRDLSVLEQSNGNTDPNMQTFSPSLVIRHPNFTENFETGATMNDIALIKLRPRVNMTGPNVRTICLPDSPPSSQDDCYVTGFGVTSTSNQHSNILQQACLPLRSIADCNNYYRGSVLQSQHICAGSSTSGSPDTCRGDSGGPLVCKKPSITGGSSIYPCGWSLAGITSFGNSPCEGGSPSVFVNVFNYKNWILETANSLGHHG